MIDKRDDEYLRQNIKGLMMTLIGQWNVQMDDARAETEFAAVRPADIHVFAQLRGRSMKLSDIHREMGFSRQAAQQAVERLVAHEMITVEPVPGSKRDKVVAITQKGNRWRSIAAAQIRLIESQIEGEIGADATKLLRQTLSQLVGRLIP